MLRISEFQSKDVVNIADGKRLGQITDFDIDLETGRISRVLVPVNGRGMRFFGKDEGMTIPWSNIVKIGSDVILVRVSSDQIEE
ncbi:YlmC/YmxH family sporulation protein [Bacillus tianshenii]|nr:YlmC/YmxH family sporulation protein [Bacillus tianshenii]